MTYPEPCSKEGADNATALNHHHKDPAVMQVALARGCLSSEAGSGSETTWSSCNKDPASSQLPVGDYSESRQKRRRLNDAACGEVLSLVRADAEGPGTSGSALGSAAGSPIDKACTKCKALKPNSAFFKDPTKRDGLACWCRVCATAKAQARKAAHQLPLSEGSSACSTLYKCVLCSTDKSIKDFKCRKDILDLRCCACRAMQRARTAKATGVHTPTHKECTRCQAVKPAEAFKRHKFTITGLDSWCKECCLERRRECPPAARTRVHVPQPTLSAKCCLQCRQTVAAEDFTRDLTKPSGLGLRCKACEAEYRRDMRQAKKIASSSEPEAATAQDLASLPALPAPPHASLPAPTAPSHPLAGASGTQPRAMAGTAGAKAARGGAKEEPGAVLMKAEEVSAAASGAGAAAVSGAAAAADSGGAGTGAFSAFSAGAGMVAADAVIAAGSCMAGVGGSSHAAASPLLAPSPSTAASGVAAEARAACMLIELPTTASSGTTNAPAAFGASDNAAGAAHLLMSEATVAASVISNQPTTNTTAAQPLAAAADRALASAPLLHMTRPAQASKPRIKLILQQGAGSQAQPAIQGHAALLELGIHSAHVPAAVPLALVAPSDSWQGPPSEPAFLQQQPSLQITGPCETQRPSTASCMELVDVHHSADQPSMPESHSWQAPWRCIPAPCATSVPSPLQHRLVSLPTHLQQQQQQQQQAHVLLGQQLADKQTTQDGDDGGMGSTHGSGTTMRRAFRLKLRMRPPPQGMSIGTSAAAQPYATRSSTEGISQSQSPLGAGRSSTGAPHAHTAMMHPYRSHSIPGDMTSMQSVLCAETSGLQGAPGSGVLPHRLTPSHSCMPMPTLDVPLSALGSCSGPAGLQSFPQHPGYMPMLHPHEQATRPMLLQSSTSAMQRPLATHPDAHHSDGMLGILSEHASMGAAEADAALLGLPLHGMMSSPAALLHGCSSGVLEDEELLMSLQHLSSGFPCSQQGLHELLDEDTDLHSLDAGPLDLDTVPHGLVGSPASHALGPSLYGLESGGDGQAVVNGSWGIQLLCGFSENSNGASVQHCWEEWGGVDALLQDK